MPLHSLGERFQEELELSLTYPDEIRADIDVAPVAARLGADGRFPADPGRVFRDTHDDLDFDTASRIIRVVLPPALRASLLDEVEALVAVQARIQAQHPRDEQIYYGSYTDFSINLFSAPLFCRGLGEFIRANREVIDTEVMPDNFYVLAEFFRTEPGRSAWVHTAASTLVSSFPVARHSHVMNLHVTLTDNTTVQAGPFLVWEDADSAVMSARYAYNYLVERGVVDEHNRDRFLRAVWMAESPNRADQGRGTRLLCRQFWHEYYTRDLKRPVRGLYALYDPGQALVFSPNKPHGGELLSREVPGRARTSINLRATRSGFGEVLGHYAR